MKTFLIIAAFALFSASCNNPSSPTGTKTDSTLNNTDTSGVMNNTDTMNRPMDTTNMPADTTNMPPQ